MDKKFKCPKCSRTFGMAAHLGRHMLSHASPQAKAAAKRKRAAAKKRTVKKGTTTKKRVIKKAKIGHPKAVISKAGLRGMSIDALTQLIADARGELRNRIAVLAKTLK